MRALALTGGHKRRSPGDETNRLRDSRKAAAAYSHTWWGTTIGASGLNFSVRNGKRWVPAAITAAICYLREIARTKRKHSKKISGY